MKYDLRMNTLKLESYLLFEEGYKPIQAVYAREYANLDPRLILSKGQYEDPIMLGRRPMKRKARLGRTPVCVVQCGLDFIEIISKNKLEHRKEPKAITKVLENI